MNYGQNHSVEDNGEVWVMQYIERKVKNNDFQNVVIFDVGANKGQYLEQLYVHIAQAQIYCFEPSPYAFSILNNKAQNMNNVSCFQLGVGHKETSGILKSEVKGSVMASFLPQAGNHTMEVTAQITTIDIFCKKNDIQHVYFLKLDIEGYELNALTGALEMIKNKKIKYIQFEFGKNNIQNGVYLKHFFDILSNYQIHRVLKDGLRKMSKYDLRHEIILTTNYLAELKHQT